MACLNITILFRNKHIADILWNVSLHINCLIPCLDLLMVNSIGFIIEVRNEFHDKIKIHGSGNEAMDDTECYNFINVSIALFIKFPCIMNGFSFIRFSAIASQNRPSKNIVKPMNAKHTHFWHRIKWHAEPALCKFVYFSIGFGIWVRTFSFLEFIDIFIGPIRCLDRNFFIYHCIGSCGIE